VFRSTTPAGFFFSPQKRRWMPACGCSAGNEPLQSIRQRRSSRAACSAASSYSGSSSMKCRLTRTE
jgi:hypothetical protein